MARRPQSGGARRPSGGATVLLVLLAIGLLLPSPGRSGTESVVPADRIVVLKADRKLLLMRRGEVLKTFWIALGRNPVGQKLEIGDGRTPEGLYTIVERQADSVFYRALRLSYPNRADRERSRALGVNPGGNIQIHAVPEGYGPQGPGARMFDWTNGCIAVTNADMDEIWPRAPLGTPVEIRP